MVFPIFDRFIKGISLKNKDNKEIDQIIKPENDGSLEIFDHFSDAYSYALNTNFNFSTEIELIEKYREMAMYPECDMAIEDIVNEAVSPDDIKNIVNIDFIDPSKTDKVKLGDSVKKQITNEFNYIYSLLDFENTAHDLFRKWYVDGKIIFHKNLWKSDKTGNKGIASLTVVDPRRIKRVKIYEKDQDGHNIIPITGNVKEEFYVYNQSGIDSNFFTGDIQKGLKIRLDSICYVDSNLYDVNKSMALSYLHKAIKPLNQLKMIEDALVIYRISRAPERRIFYVDVGNLPHKKAEAYLSTIMNKYKNKTIYDQKTGEIKNNRKFATMMEDYWLPRREGSRGTEISTLPGGQNLGDIEDVTYFLNKLYKSLNVPISRLQPDDTFNLGRASEITRDEIKFAKFINRLQTRFESIFYDILQTQLILKNVVKDKSEFNSIRDYIRFIWNKDSFFAESKENEILSDRLRLVSDADNYTKKYFSTEWVRKNILKQTDEEIKQEDEKVKKDLEREKELGTDEDKGW